MLRASILLLACSAAASEQHPFPHYPNSFSYDLTIFKDHSTTPFISLSYAWDQSGQRSKYAVNNSVAHTYELQLRLCNDGHNFDIKGSAGGDPSKFVCQDLGGFACPVTPYWIYPKPGAAVWNGTDTINGLKCDRFDITNPMGRQTFWGTPTTPCRAITNNGVYEQQDYSNWVPAAPPAAVFAPPAWLDTAKCKPLSDAATSVTTQVRRHGVHQFTSI